MNLKRFVNVLAEIRMLCAYTPRCEDCEFNYIDESGCVGCFCQSYILPNDWKLDTIRERAKAQEEEKRAKNG